MKIHKEELIAVLSQFNPWWRGELSASFFPLTVWKRSLFEELYQWMSKPPAPRAVLLSGARQVGKTTLFLQVIRTLIQDKVPPANILYVTFDHPILKLAGIDAVLEAWREREPALAGPEYLFLDEPQFITDWGVWVKHQVDFNKNRRIALSGSAVPLIEKGQESGVGRWHTLRLSTLSFYEYMQLKLISPPSNEITSSSIVSTPLPALNALTDLFSWAPQDFNRVSELARPYVGHFHEYLLRGGFPQTAQVENISQAQRLLREDIIDKVLKRDMTALFGVRRILDLENTFLYLCLHDGGLLDMTKLCDSLSVKRPTAQSFIELLESTHLIYKLPPLGYGKDILRARFKIYLADAAIAPAVMLRDKAVLEDAQACGIIIETTVAKHLMTTSHKQNVRFSYWHGKKAVEVDLIAEMNGHFIPFEIKQRVQHTAFKDLKGLSEFCEKKKPTQAYVVTKSITDFGLMSHPFFKETGTRVLKIPAPLLCYWLGSLEKSLRA
jgi:predicted AAA+ superfamily ATPase